MSRNKKLNKTLIITVILAIVAFFMIFNNKHSTISKEESEFYVEDTASITKIYMADKKDNSLLLERTDGPKWKLNKNYFVRKDIMQTLLKTLYKMRVRQPIPNAAAENAIKQLATTSTKVEVYQNTYRINLFNKIKLFPYEKLTKVFYVGYDSQDNMGTVMLLEGADKPYINHIPGFRGVLSTRFLVRQADWRDLTVFSKKIKDIYKVDVELPMNKEESYKLVNNNDKTISLLSETGKNIPYIDTIKVLRYLNYFQDLNLSEFFIDGRDVIDSLLNNEKPTHIITIEDINGEKQTIKVFLMKNREIPLMEEQLGLMTEEEIQKYKEDEGEISEWDPNSFYVIFNNDKDVGLAPTWTFSKIMRTKNYFTNISGQKEE